MPNSRWLELTDYISYGEETPPKVWILIDNIAVIREERYDSSTIVFKMGGSVLVDENPKEVMALVHQLNKEEQTDDWRSCKRCLNYQEVRGE